MKLTNYLRDAFINAAMQDVPAVDYDAQIRKMLTDGAVSTLPPKIRKIYEDPSTREYVRVSELGYKFKYISVPGLGMLPPEAAGKYDALSALKTAQTKQRNDLMDKLRSVAYSATTRKKLAEMLPEFAKYLPAEEVKSENLPAISNVVAEFSKAGWPKGKSE